VGVYGAAHGHPIRNVQVGGLCGQLWRLDVEQRWVIAIKAKIQLPNTLPIILNCVIGIIN